MSIVIWTQDQMKTLQEYAEAHPIMARAVLSGRTLAAGQIPGHVLDLEGGVRVVYSIESDQPMGPCRHLSVSVETPGKWPNPTMVQLIAKELGFRPDFRDGSLWQDEKYRAMNWVQVKDLN